MSKEAKQWAGQELAEDWRKPLNIKVLMAIADLSDQRGICEATIDELAAHAEVSTMTVKRNIAKLLAGETISRTARSHQPTVTVIAPFHSAYKRRPMRALPEDLKLEAV